MLHSGILMVELKDMGMHFELSFKTLSINKQNYKKVHKQQQIECKQSTFVQHQHSVVIAEKYSVQMERCENHFVFLTNFKRCVKKKKKSAEMFHCRNLNVQLKIIVESIGSLRNHYKVLPVLMFKKRLGGTAALDLFIESLNGDYLV